MGGALQVQSRLGEGSTFWATIRLPLAPEPAAEPRPGVDLTGIRVLIVDDNEVNRRVLREILGSWKMRIGEAESGGTALAALRTASAAGDPYRITITDFHMPGMDGEALGRAIKADPALRDGALVLLSSVGQQGEGARFRAAGFAAYLVKPVRASQLMDALATAWASLTRPAARGPEPRSRRPAAAPERRPPPLAAEAHVLVVEDNWVNQQVARGVLARLGCRVDVAGSGREAVSLLEEGAYDVVFMDCEMPEMDGYAATAEIRRREGSGPRVPIVAMTAHAMEGDREKCLAAGMDDYLSKPLEPEAIDAALRRWVRLDSRMPAARVPPAPARPGAAPALDDAAEAPPVLDPDRLTRLRAALTTGGSLALFARVLEGFIGDAGQRVAALRRAVEGADAPAVRQVAHALRSSCVNVGAARMAAVAEALERLAGAGALAGAAGLVERLERELVQAEAALTPVLRGGTT
jgi:CheY-like chemotaxis protein/HPt (histidine-containing phosphotransfer) domain-containing protein